MVYDPGTSEDLASPASGTGTFVVTVGSVSVPKAGVPFTGVISDASGKVTAIGVQMPSAFRAENIVGPGSELLIPQGLLAYVLPDKLNLTSGATLTLPFRSKSGNPVKATIAAIRGSVTVEGSAKLNLDQIALTGDAVQQGLVFPGVRIASAPLDFEATWTPSSSVGWTLKAASAAVGLGIPGLATTGNGPNLSSEYPLEATVTNLVVKHDGTVTFSEANLTTNKGFLLPEAAGFELTIKGGKVRMADSVPTFTAVVVDIVLPESVTEESTPARAKLQNVTLQISDGVRAAVGSLRCRVRGVFKLTATNVDLDFSSGLAPTGAPAPFSNPAWMGLLIKNGQLEVPTGGSDKVTIAVQNFVVEPGGVTGKATLASTPEIKVSGFALRNATGSVDLIKSQVKAGQFAGTLICGPEYALSSEVIVGSDGRLAIKVGSDQALQLGPVGLTIRNLSAEFEGQRVSISGNLGLNPDIEALPPGLREIELAITDLQIDKDGQFYLPQSGLITFPDPKPIEIGVLSIELRQIGLYSQNNQIQSVLFSGGAGIKGMEDVLPISGELDFEGFTINRTATGPKFSLNGIGLNAEIFGVGSLKASLYKENIAGFGETLYGDAELILTCLGDMKAGIGLTFLVAPVPAAPADSAFFVGGRVTIPPVRIDTPPTPSSPPIPLFNIVGFSGGFGYNVAPKEEGIGLIMEPQNQLKRLPGELLLQAGILLADPAPAAATGKIWWADTVLTLTLNPITVDLTARASFLDMAGYGFLPVSEWKERDRIVEAYMNLDFSRPAFTVGGSMDLTFPTRDASIVNAEGEFKMQVSPGEMFLRVGWEPAGQRPLKLQFLKALDGVADITARAGMEVLMNKPASSPFLVVQKAEMFLDISAEISVPGAEVDGRMQGMLTMRNVGTAEFSADGRVGLEANVDFGFFSARAEASLDAKFNTPGHRKELYLNGTVRGEIAGFEGSAEVTLVAKAA